MQTGLSIRRVGRGERIVFLHGSTKQAGSMWEPQLGLAARYELVIPDRRGWGKSPPGTTNDLTTQVEELACLLGDRSHLVGFSYGGLLALLIAARYPERIISLVLHEPPVFQLARGGEHIEDQIALLQHAYELAPDGDPEVFLSRFLAATGVPQPGQIALPPEQRAAVVRMMQEPNSIVVDVPVDAVRTAAFPKLVFSGQSLPSFTVLCHSLAKQINAELMEIPEASHGVRHPGFTEAVERFIATSGSMGPPPTP